MKKLWIFLICLIIVGALAVGGYILWKNMNVEPVIVESSGEEPIVEVSLSEKANVVPISIKEEARGINRIIDVEYPSIQSFKNKNFQKSINDEITKVIFAYRDEINAIVDNETATTELYEYRSSFERYNHGDYLSLVISNDYETGGIRTNKWKDIYNINVNTERLIYLKDIFPATVDYEKQI